MIIIGNIRNYSRFYLDPILSLFITGLILMSTIPLVKSAGFILLQGTPTKVDLKVLRTNIIELENVLAIHEFHVWVLDSFMLAIIRYKSGCIFAFTMS